MSLGWVFPCPKCALKRMVWISASMPCSPHRRTFLGDNPRCEVQELVYLLSVDWQYHQTVKVPTFSKGSDLCFTGLFTHDRNSSLSNFWLEWAFVSGIHSDTCLYLGAFLTRTFGVLQKMDPTSKGSSVRYLLNHMCDTFLSHMCAYFWSALMARLPALSSQKCAILSSYCKRKSQIVSCFCRRFVDWISDFQVLPDFFRSHASHVWSLNLCLYCSRLCHNRGIFSSIVSSTFQFCFQLRGWQSVNAMFASTRQFNFNASYACAAL